MGGADSGAVFRATPSSRAIAFFEPHPRSANSRIAVTICPSITGNAASAHTASGHVDEFLVNVKAGIRLTSGSLLHEVRCKP